MREVIYGGAVSAGLCLAGPGEAMDWLRWNDDSGEDQRGELRGVDAMLDGRKTFDFAQRMGGGPVPAGVATYVLSRTLDEGEFRARTSPGRSAPELVREDAAEFVRRLKAEPSPSTTPLDSARDRLRTGGNILVMRGGELESVLLEAGLVDEIGFSLHPVLLGGGTPVFGPFSRRIELELIEARPIALECVLVRYRVKS